MPHVWGKYMWEETCPPWIIMFHKEIPHRVMSSFMKLLKNVLLKKYKVLFCAENVFYLGKHLRIPCLLAWQITSCLWKASAASQSPTRKQRSWHLNGHKSTQRCQKVPNDAAKRAWLRAWKMSGYYVHHVHLRQNWPRFTFNKLQLKVTSLSACPWNTMHSYQLFLFNPAVH